jgi:hypothetical protein
LQCVLAAKILTVDFVVCTLAVKKKSGQVSTCRIGPFPCQSISRWISIAVAPSDPRSSDVGFVVNKVALRRVSPVNSHSANRSTIINPTIDATQSRC